jgi:uncharacterized repeat protein (TIGR02543 family)
MLYDGLTDAYVLFTEVDGYAEILHNGGLFLYWISGSQGQAWVDINVLGHYHYREFLPVTGLVDAATPETDQESVAVFLKSDSTIDVEAHYSAQLDGIKDIIDVTVACFYSIYALAEDGTIYEIREGGVTAFPDFTTPSPPKPLFSNTYTVTYSGNGHTSGSTPGNQSRTGGLWLSLRANSGNLAKAGYSFAGWNTKADGTGIDYAAGSAAKLGALNRTLYAKWIANGNTGYPAWTYMFTDTDFVHISSDFAQPRRPTHNGIDIISKNSGGNHIYGAPIKNACAGIVKITTTGSLSAGNYVVVETTTIDPSTGKNLMVRYLHMASAPLVTVGSFISVGTILGYVGNTGNVDPAPTTHNPLAGTHLHFDVNNAGIYLTGALVSDCVDPILFFPHVNFTYQYGRV